MKKASILVLLGIVLLNGCMQKTTDGIKVDESVFPDEIFRGYISEFVDTDKDGFLSKEEIDSVKQIFVRASTDERYHDITSIKGIELFTELEELSITRTRVTEFDLSNNNKLTYLQCIDTDISSIDTGLFPKLRDLQIGGTKIDSIDLSNNPELEALDVSDTVIGNLDLSNNPKLMAVHCSNCDNLCSLDLKNNPHIQEISIDYSGISKLDVSGFSEINTVVCDMDDEILGCDERLILRRDK
ncbi:leucine-rich repeat domain-containing protein [Butyrivibrio sp. X503]|uniref:leucine-rich repeat domain-containing protein n=1 Tax=Butyrivibrio sp. X503 TaxID=2364878 RepID=UPI000EA8CE82|nr:leucine-rich repeat domain-containing protein [Butyrivibrio sp. X503]RKM57963.1 leucine-rich repeat domain-containing protein [Butyrivibrio sp. X503]